MDYKEFFAQVKAGGLRGAYLFEGTEEYVKASALAAVEKALLPPGMEQLNEAVLENPAADALIAAAETLPFLADKRLVVARELSAFTGRGEGDDRLGEYLARIPESCVLILYVQGKADARKKLYQAVKKHGTVVSFQPMDEAELNRWLVRTAKGMGKELSLGDAAYLAFLVGSDAATLKTELEKLSALTGERAEITRGDMYAICSRTMECTVFEMVDAVVAGQEGRAFALMHDMLATGGDRLGILAMLLRQYRLMFHVKVMQREKLPPAQIKKNLGLPGFAADRTLRQAAGYTGWQARQAMETCLRAEYRVKSGAWNQEGALEAAMLEIFQLRKGAKA